MRPTLLAYGLLLLAATDSGRMLAGEPNASALAHQTLEILKTHCYRCHGQNGANEGGFNYVTDLRQLVSRRRVVPADAAKSKLLKRITNSDDPMPPAEEKIRPDKDEIAVLKKWIEAGAPAAQEPAPRLFLASADMVQMIHDDLAGANLRDRPFLRYFTLTHLHNAGLSGEQMQSYRHGVSKLINSLSWSKKIIVPKTLDRAGTVLRIDLRDYQWNEKTWEIIVERYPYGVLLDGDTAKSCAEAANCQLPYVRADWFVAVASRPPLYHDILKLPRAESDLEKMLLVDTRENLRQERAVRAGFNSSGVSRNNRLIERHESGTTVYWKSYDFASNIGRQNLFAHPMGPGKHDAEFLHDGGEIIFSLPNGLQAYYLVDGKGQRIDKGLTAIVSDPRRPDRAVENGLSCMSCHSRGIIEKTDQVRSHAMKNPYAFSKGAMETLLALYPPADRMTALMRTDAKRFQDAVAQTGAPLSPTEPIAALAMRFEAELDLPLAAAEVGVAARDLLKILDRYPHLAKQLGPMRLEGGTVQRQVFVDTFHDLAEALKQGTVLASRNVQADKMVRQGNALLATDLAGALQAYEQALVHQSDNAQAHAGKGDVYRLRGDYAQAVLAYSEAIRLDPRSPHFFNNRGLCAYRQGEHDKALENYTAALRLDPRFAAAYHNRGVAYFSKGELDRAIADYDEALLYDGQSPLFYNNRGYAFFEQEDHGRALADFDKALSLDPRFAPAYHNRGLVHLHKNKLSQAIADFSTAIKLQPRLARAYLHRSSAFSKLGDKLRAEADLRKAVELDPALEKE